MTLLLTSTVSLRLKNGLPATVSGEPVFAIAESKWFHGLPVSADAKLIVPVPAIPSSVL